MQPFQPYTNEKEGQSIDVRSSELQTWLRSTEWVINQIAMVFFIFYFLHKTGSAAFTV